MLKTDEIVKQRYKVESVIGQGGMSTVYLVRDLVLESKWAMKETLDIFPDRDKSEIIDQFKKEAKILANLSHPNLPRVIDYFDEMGKHYLVEEYINGRSSEDVLKSSTVFDEVRILRWAVQVCDLLAFLHNNGIVYRDLKPGNILVDDNDNIHLVDFGIARFFQGGKNRDTVIIGTPGFASPEHYGRGETDCRSDIFSLGATLHYMTTGVDPADRPFHFEIPYFINPGVSFYTSSIIMKCLELDSARRYQTAEEVKEAIESIALPNLKKATRPLEPPRRLDRAEKYINHTDIVGKTVQLLSYTSVFPASIGISGLMAFGATIFGPIPSFIVGAASFPLLCIEFWKRLDRVFQDQLASIKIDENGLKYRSSKLNLECRWPEITELRIIRNQTFSLRKINEVRVKTNNGEFVFDESYKDYRRLVDTIITQAGLSLVDENKFCTIYGRF